MYDWDYLSGVGISDQMTELSPWPNGWEPPEYTGSSQADPSTHLGDLVVTARRSTDGGANYTGSWVSWLDDVSVGDSSVEYPNYAPPSRPPNWNDCLDWQIDGIAVSAANQILLMPDDDFREYGFLIYRDANGNMQLSAIIYGDNGSLTGLGAGALPSDFGLNSWSQVIGLVHSHPRYGETFPGSGVYSDMTAPLQNTSHWENPSEGDWEWPDFLAPQSFNENMFRQYILFDGELREFDLYNNLRNGQTDAQRRANLQLGENDPTARCS